jgi:hypothetical protein
VNVAADAGNAARSTTKTAVDPGESLGECLYQGSSDRVDKNRNESFEPEHGPMMALCGANLKKGKYGCPATQGEAATFSRLFNFRFSR